MLNNKTFLDLTHAQAVDYLVSCPSRLEIMVSRIVIRTQSGKRVALLLRLYQLQVHFQKIKIQLQSLIAKLNLFKHACL